jgi:arginyl-tRNA synthetase
MFNDIQQTVEEKISAYAVENGITLPPLKWTAIPFSGEWGMATSFFQAAADEARAGRNPGKPVPARAQEMAEQVRQKLGDLPGTSHIEAIKGYLNIYFESSEFARRVVDEVLAKGADFGRGAPKTDRVMIEYAQPNTHHSFHIGHSRTALLGESLARIMQFSGYETIRASYPGDIGLSVITTLWAYDKFHKGQEPDGVHERGQWLAKIYIEANKLLEAKEGETPEEKAQREAYDRERRELYLKWNDGDPYVRELWQRTREWSLVELQDILDTMGIHIDVWFYESEADEPAKQIVKGLIDLGIAEDERPQGGPVIVKIDEKLGLKKEKYRTTVLLRNDGTTLYLTKDLALAKIKFETYHVDRSIYVVDFRQNLHFQQVFKILELWGFPQASKCYHLSYGFITLPEGAMSSRKGRVVLFKDVADEAVRRVLAVESEKSGDVPADQRMKIAALFDPIRR